MSGAVAQAMRYAGCPNRRSLGFKRSVPPRLNEGGVPVTYLTDLVKHKFPASTSYIEQIPGVASLTRDLVSMPHPPRLVVLLRGNWN